MGDIGLYFDKNNYMSYSPRIEIAKGLKKHRRISILAHEIGHALCSEKNCKCMIGRNNHILAEYHAFKFELGWLLKHKQKKALKSAIHDIKDYHDVNAHQFAAERIMKLKLWQKCLGYVK